MRNARCNKSIRDEITTQGEVIDAITTLLEDSDCKNKVDGTCRLMTLTLESNILLNGVRVELGVIESLLQWETSQGRPHEFILSKMGEHVELSD